jgi:hypothetical protein
MRVLKRTLTPFASVADQLAGELYGKGNTALEAACDTLCAELRGQLGRSTALDFTAGCAAMVRERIAATNR